MILIGEMLLICMLFNPDDRRINYNPDAIWAKSQGGGIQLIVWEVETDPGCKTIAGDFTMASQARSPHAEYYPYREFKDENGEWKVNTVGYKLLKPERFIDIFDKRKTAQTMKPEERNRFYGTDITQFRFYLIFYDTEQAAYFERYIRFLTRKQFGKETPFSDVQCLVCSSNHLRGTRVTIGGILSKIL